MHITIIIQIIEQLKQKPADVKSSTYTDPSKNNNNKDSELKTGDILRTSKY